MSDKDRTIRVLPDGRADRLDVVTPAGTMVVHKVRDTLVLLVPGYHRPAPAIPRYARQSYEVYRVSAEENDERGALLHARLLVRFNA